MKKSSKHAKITGDFAEGLVLYWLSKYGYECARIDHTGIDLIARDPASPDLLGISVKSRSRYNGTEYASINIPTDGFRKAEDACRAFACIPYYAIAVDGGGVIRGFLLSLEHLKRLIGDESKPMRYWKMTSRDLAKYREDPKIRRFELQSVTCSLRDTMPNTEIDDREERRKNVRTARGTKPALGS